MRRRPSGRLAGLVLVPVLLGAAASALGSLALFSVALGLALVFVGAALATRLGARRLRVSRSIDRHEILEGRPLTMAFRVAGLRGLPVHVEVLTADGTWQPLGDDGDAWPCTIDRPGAHVLEPSSMRVCDDLGLLARPTHAGRPEVVLVLPEPDGVETIRRRGGADPVGDPDPDGLRPYVPGTPMSRIHWATAARGGELQERHFAISRDHLPLVVVETAGASDGQALDWVARIAAGRILSLARAGGCRVLLPGDRVPTTVTDPLAQWPAMHRRLAALAPDGAGPPGTGRDRDTVRVSARLAPPADGPRRALPPGVVSLETWTATADTATTAVATT